MQNSLWKNLAVTACAAVVGIGIACSEHPAAPDARLDPFSAQPRMDGYNCVYAEFSNGTEVWNCADYWLETVYVYDWSTSDPGPPEDTPSCAIYGTCVVESDPCIENPDACGFTYYDTSGGESVANGQDIGFEDGTTDCSDPSGDGYGALDEPNGNGYAALSMPDGDGYLTLHAPGPNASENLAAIGLGAGVGTSWTYLAPNTDAAVIETNCALFQQCLREIYDWEGEYILMKASMSGEWTYTQGGAQGGVEPSRSIANKRGDCTDYTMNAIKEYFASATGTTWPHPWSQKLSTSMFHSLSDAELLNHGYMRVTTPRKGDVVVRGGHAGIYTGMNNGRVMGYADNGRPAVAGVDGSYRDGATGWFNFSPTTDRNGNPVNPEFFRPMVYSIYCDP